MLSVTIANLLTRVRRRCDLENDAHVADAELQALLSESIGEMQLTVLRAGHNYFRTEAAISLSTFALPSDHLATLGVAFVYDSAGRRRPLEEIQEQERNRWLGMTGEARVYIHDGQTIKLYPVPSTGTYYLTYHPQPTDYSSSDTSTSVDLVTMDGHAFVIEATCVKALRKSETDVQSFMIERDAAKQRLEDWAQERSRHSPKRMVTFEDIYGESHDPALWWRP